MVRNSILNTCDANTCQREAKGSVDQLFGLEVQNIANNNQEAANNKQELASDDQEGAVYLQYKANKYQEKTKKAIEDLKELINKNKEIIKDLQNEASNYQSNANEYRNKALLSYEYAKSVQLLASNSQIKADQENGSVEEDRLKNLVDAKNNNEKLEYIKLMLEKAEVRSKTNEKLVMENQQKLNGLF